MKTVFVIGAGFSKEAGFPLTEEFTDEEKITKIRSNLNETERQRLDKVTGYFLNRIQEKYCKDNIESVLNHIAVADYLAMEATTNDAETYPSSQIFSDLLWYIARVLKESAKSTVPVEYEKFVKYAYDNKCPVISFNYDLIIEEALRKLNIECDYGFDTIPIDNSLFLMKMHGSVNWAFCSKCENVVIFSGYEASNIVGGTSKCSVCNECTLETIIIPPILYKDTFYKHPRYEDLIRQLWGFANDELVEADKVVFIGFSMAETDAYAQELFKFSSNMNKNVKYHLVTRPKSDKGIDNLVDRYEEVLVGNSIEVIKKPFCEYVNEIT